MYIVYIFDKKGNNISQIFNISNIDIKLKNNDIGTASFICDNGKLNYPTIKENNRISIRLIDGKNEKEMFYGIITGVKLNLEQCEIQCKTELYLLKKKIYYAL